MRLNPDLFKEVSKHNLNYDVLKSMGLGYGLLSSLRKDMKCETDEHLCGMVNWQSEKELQMINNVF